MPALLKVLDCTTPIYGRAAGLAMTQEFLGIQYWRGGPGEWYWRGMGLREKVENYGLLTRTALCS